MPYVKKIKISDSLGISSIGNLAMDKNIIYICNKDGLQKKIHKFNVNGTYINFIKTDKPISTFTYDDINKKFYTHYSNNYSKNTLIHILDENGKLLNFIDYSNIIPEEILYKEKQPWDIKDITLDISKKYLLFSLENSNNIYTISLNNNFINVFNFKTNDLFVNKFGHTLSIGSNSSLWLTYVNISQQIKLANISSEGLINEIVDTNLKITETNIGGIIIDNENFNNKCVLWLSCTHNIPINNKKLVAFSLPNCYKKDNYELLDQTLNKITNNLPPLKTVIFNFLMTENNLIQKSLDMNLSEEKLLEINSTINSTINSLSTLENIINSKFTKIELK